MKSSRSSRVTQLLEKFEPGDRHAEEQLFADVYTELRALAARYLHRERKSHTLQPTALVHEAYLKLVGQTRVDWQGRAHFLAIAAQAMRQILVDHARRHRAAKRGGNRHRIALDDNLVIESESRRRPVGAGRCLDQAHKARPAPGPNDRTAILWRPEHRGSGEGDGDIQTIGGAGMDHGSCVVAARTQQERRAMSTERYAQVRRLFLAACELAESEIGAFLDHACAGDPKLREELESLLKQPRYDDHHRHVKRRRRPRQDPFSHRPSSPGTYSRRYPR